MSVCLLLVAESLELGAPRFVVANATGSGGNRAWGSLLLVFAASRDGKDVGTCVATLCLSPNKRMQRARIVDKFVLRLGHRRVADAQR
jgi:hypothetical protein